MKKINTYSTQYKTIQPRKNNPNPHSFANKSLNKNPNTKKLTKDRQEIVNNIVASGFKQFNL